MSFDLSTHLGFCMGMTDKGPLYTANHDTLSQVQDDAASSEALIEAIASQRSRLAYGLLFKRFAPKLKAFVMGQGMTAPEAEDLAQDALLSVWRKADYFDAKKATASTWIYTIARNLRIDAIRRQRRVKDLPEDLWQGEGERRADDRLIDAQQGRGLMTHIESLSKEQSDVLRMSFYEDLSHGDIAKALSLPLGTVKSRLRLAIMRLRSLVGPQVDTIGAAGSMTTTVTKADV
jgi:RNA polymerase sigma-70 factor, ECF subfamily